MYSKFKKLLSKILPWKIILKNEFFLRKLFAMFYFGRSVYCTICNRQFSRFLDVHDDDKMCPRCGSLGRHRRLWQIINNELSINIENKILDFSPSRIFFKKLKEKYPYYISSDYLENPLVDRRYDITAIPEPSDSFDLILCYHILEHIENDIKAMSELFRILKKNGNVIIQTPFKDGDNYENPGIISKEDRLLHFGQEDHVRIYSVNGLKERLQSMGFKIKILNYTEDNNNIFGFKSKEFVIIATK